MTEYPPLPYVTEPIAWEYKYVTIDVAHQSLPSETDLNDLGQEGWELTAAFIVSNEAHFYFERIK